MQYAFHDPTLESVAEVLKFADQHLTPGRITDHPLYTLAMLDVQEAIDTLQKFHEELTGLYHASKEGE